MKIEVLRDPFQMEVRVQNSAGAMVSVGKLHNSTPPSMTINLNSPEAFKPSWKTYELAPNPQETPWETFQTVLLGIHDVNLDDSERPEWF